MECIIRPVRPSDAADINEMRRLPGVFETILGITSERESQTADFLANQSERDHLLVAEISAAGQPKVVGLVGLSRNRAPRTAHAASLGIMVHAAYQDRGIGSALLQHILDLADNWLLLVRIELSVFTDNERAIALYKSHGFNIEGTRKYAAIRNGRYADEFLMARYQQPPALNENTNIN